MILYIPFCHLVLSPWAHVSRHYVHFRSFLSLPREAHSSPDPQRSAWWALKPVPSWPPWHAEPWFTLASPASSLVAPLGVLSCCSVTWSCKYLGPLGSWLLSCVLPRSVISPGPVVWPLTSPQLPSVYIQPGPALQGLSSSCLDISAWTLLTDTSNTTRPNSCPLAPTKTWPSCGFSHLRNCWVPSSTCKHIWDLFLPRGVSRSYQQNLPKGSLNSTTSPPCCCRLPVSISPFAYCCGLLTAFL